MKKILSMLVGLGILVQMSAVSYGFKDIKNDEAIDTVCGIGLMEGKKEDMFLPDEEVTRGDFAGVIANIYLESVDADEKWSEKYFKSIEEETKEISSLPDTETKFSDVFTNDPIYEAIRIVYEKNLMTGMSDSFFGIEETMTKEQAIKVIVTLLGYQPEAQNKGGYPAGYLSVASELGILKGFGGLSGNITRKDVAKLLYNSFDIPVMQLSIDSDGIRYETVEDETFLRKILGLLVHEGRVEDNGYSTLTGKSLNAQDVVTVNGLKFEVSDDTAYIRDYLGRNITIYYPEDDDTDGFIYAGLVEDEEQLTFSSEEFVDYSDGYITYISGTKEKRVKVKPNAYMIYNGSGKGSFDKSDFIFNKGDITLITDKGETAAETIVVNSYRNFNISYVDEKNECIYSENTLVNSEKMLNLSREESVKNISIYAQDGEKAQFGVLSKGNVLSVLESDYSLKVFVSDMSADNVTVKGIKTDDGKTIVVTSEGEYTMSKDFIEMNPAKKPAIGETYSFLLDIFGEIVGFEGVLNDGNIGIIARVYETDETDSEMAVKFYTKAMTFETKLLAEKVKITDTEGNTKKYQQQTQSVAIADLLKNDTIFRYELNEKDEISVIELPGKQEKEGDENNRLVEISFGGLDDYTADGYYYKLNQGFAGSVLTNNSTVVFGVNSLEADYNRKYNVYTISEFLNDRRYLIKGYTTKANSAVAEYILYDSKNASAFNYSNKEIAIVTGITKGLDEDDMPVTLIKAVVSEGSSLNSAVKKELVLSDDAVIKNVKNLQGETAYGNGQKFKIENGDIIKYTKDNRGRINKLYLLFDENGENPVSGGKGIMPGTTGYWDTSDYTHSNPFAITSAGVFSNKAIAWSCSGSAEMKIERANPISVIGTALRYTTQDLNKFSYNRESESYRTYNYIVSQNVIFVSKEGKDITVETGSISNIKTYEQAGKDCDRLFIMSRIGAPSKIVVFRDYIN